MADNGNPIRRFVKLVLDQAAAAKTEADAKKRLGGVDTALGKIKATAMKVGAAIAAAFALNKLLDFGRAAVAEAMKAEKAWSELAGVIEAVGENSAEMKEEILAAGEAFQEVTTHGADDYMEALARMVTLTGDVTASTQNMALVADVAARFYDGELGPAVELVSKVMNGNTNALQRMGIEVENAQEGLEVLATRSFGAAADRAQTFGGRLERLRENWNDVLESIGKAIIESDGADKALGFLSATVAALTDFVKRNKDEIQTWVTRGVDFAIAAVDVLYRATKSLALIIAGSLVAAWGVSIRAAGKLVSAYSAVVRAAGYVALAMGQGGLSGILIAHAAAVSEDAAAIDEWAKALTSLGSADVAEGLRILATPAFTPGQFRARGAPRAPAGAPPKPVLSSAGREKSERETELSAEDQALTEFLQSMDTARTLSLLLGEDFDALGAEASALEAVMTSLAKAGVDENSELMNIFADRLRTVRKEMSDLEKVTKMEEEALKAQAMAAGELASALGAAMEGGLGPFAKQKARQNVLEAAELTIRAGMALLTGFGAARAGAFARAAGRHLGLAAAWGALGASAGGSGGSGAATVPVSTGDSGGLTPTTSRTTSSNSSARTQPMGAEVSLYLVGEGFDAVNPRVQRVVRGAMQEGNERFGPNAVTRVIRTGASR